MTALAAQFDIRARETETLATLPADLAGEAKAAGLFRLAMPAALGGLEVDPAILVEVIEELSRADASAGWCTAIANATAFFAWLDPMIAADLLAGRADIAVSGSFAPLGRLAPTRAGYRLTGRWPFVSGCRHADWFFQGGFVMEGDAPRMLPGWGQRGRDHRQLGRRRPAWYRQPRCRRGRGRCAGGAHDRAVLPAGQSPRPHLAVPVLHADRHAVRGCPARHRSSGAGRVHRARQDQDPRRRHGHAGGGGRHPARARPRGGWPAGSSFVFDTLGTLWETACLGDVPDAPARARFLLANQQAMRAARDAVDTACGLAGASAIYADHPLQRCFRDLHAAAQHVYFSATSAKRYARNHFGVAQPEFMF